MSKARSLYLKEQSLFCNLKKHDLYFAIKMLALYLLQNENGLLDLIFKSKSLNYHIDNKLESQFSSNVLYHIRILVGKSPEYFSIENLICSRYIKPIVLLGRVLFQLG